MLETKKKHIIHEDLGEIVEIAVLHQMCRDIPEAVVKFINYLYCQHGLQPAMIAACAVVKLDDMRKYPQ